MDAVVLQRLVDEMYQQGAFLKPSKYIWHEATLVDIGNL